MYEYGSKNLDPVGFDPTTMGIGRSGQKLVRDDVVFAAPRSRDAAMLDAIRKLDIQSAETTEVDHI
jgi:hypothetical protein